MAKARTMRKNAGNGRKEGNPIKRWIIYFIMIIFPVALFLFLLLPISVFAPFKFELLVPDNMLFTAYIFAIAILVVVVSRYAFEYAWEWGLNESRKKR